MPRAIEKTEKPTYLFSPLDRLNADLKEAAKTLTPSEVRWYVHRYYQMQDQRKSVANQLRASSVAGEPNRLLVFDLQQSRKHEQVIKDSMQLYAESTKAGRWMLCAPPESLVATQNGKEKPISSLMNGDTVMSFDRHKGYLVGKRDRFAKHITVQERQYYGPLFSVGVDHKVTRVTPEHKWPVQWIPRDDLYIVYLMRTQLRFRVGWTKLFDKTNGFGLTTRMRFQGADCGWILTICDTKQAASFEESFVATQYGLPVLPFLPGSNCGLYSSEGITQFFERLDAQEQIERATKCLHAYGRSLHCPLITARTIAQQKRFSSSPLIVHSTNLFPGLVKIALPVSTNKARWQPLQSITSAFYDGPVYSLDVEKHHTYIQDGIITHNSHYGIGPVISSGILANIDIQIAATVAHIWNFAGLNHRIKWLSREEANAWVRDWTKANGEVTEETVVIAATHFGRKAATILRDATTDKKHPGEARKLTATSLSAALARCPWNQKLKTLAWKASDCFKKFSNRNTHDNLYGELYRKYKLVSIEKNLRGDFAYLAEETLATRTIQDPKYREIYQAGRLPDGRVDLRAMRATVKIFLSHVHHVLYETTFGTPPPRPYILAHDPGHVHYIPPPHWPFNDTPGAYAPAPDDDEDDDNGAGVTAKVPQK